MTAPRKPFVVAGIIVAALAIFSAGRYSAPRPKIEKSVEYKERVVWKDRDVEKRVEGPVRVVVKTRQIPGPQGPTIETIRTVERGPVSVVKQHDGQALSETQLQAKLTITPQGPRLLIGPTVGASIRDPFVPVYGGLAAWRFGGPFWLIAAADSGGSVRAGLAIQF